MVFLGAERAAGQQLAGSVVETTGRPIPDALVGIMDEDRTLLRSVQSDNEGSFHLLAPGSGEYYIYVAKLGYRSLFDGPYEIQEEEGLEVTAVMHPFPVQLNRLEAEGTMGEAVPRLAAVGYYDRKAVGLGTFLEKPEIEEKVGLYISDVFRGIPRLRVERILPEIGGPGEFVRPELLIRSPKGYCWPTLFLDGIVAAIGGSRDLGGRPVRPDDHVANWEDVEAIEIYKGPSESPAQYNPPAGCGVVLIWTQHAVTGRGRG